MLELLTIVTALCALLVHMTEDALPADFIVPPLCMLMLLIGGRSPYYVFRQDGLLIAMKHLIGTPPSIFLASASLLYSYSFLTLIFVPASMFEIAVVRPTLFSQLRTQIPEGAAWTAIGLAIISLATRHDTGLRNPDRKSDRPAPPVSYLRVFACFLALNGASISLHVYAYMQGWTNLISEGGFAKLFGPLANVASILSGLGFFFPAAWMTVYFLSKRKTMLLCALLSWAFEIGFGMVYGQKAAIIAPSIAIMFSVVLFTRRIPIWRTILVALLVVPLLAVAIGARTAAYRGIVAGDMGVMKFVTLSAELGFSGSTSYGTAGDLPLSSYLLSRFNIAIPLLAAISYVNQNEPTYDIGPYLNILLALVPSFVFPIKPKPFDVNEFGRDVGLINATDLFTAIRPSFFGDFFYNFGAPGIAIGSFLFALFLRAISRNRAIGFRSVFVLYCACVLFDIENSVSNVAGGIIKAFVLFYLVERFSRTSQRHILHLSRGRVAPSKVVQSNRLGGHLMHFTRTKLFIISALTLPCSTVSSGQNGAIGRTITYRSQIYTHYVQPHAQTLAPPTLTGLSSHAPSLQVSISSNKEIGLGHNSAKV